MAVIQSTSNLDVEERHPFINPEEFAGYIGNAELFKELPEKLLIRVANAALSDPEVEAAKDEICKVLESLRVPREETENFFFQWVITIALLAPQRSELTKSELVELLAQSAGYHSFIPVDYKAKTFIDLELAAAHFLIFFPLQERRAALEEKSQETRYAEEATVLEERKVNARVWQTDLICFAQKVAVIAILARYHIERRFVSLGYDRWKAALVAMPDTKTCWLREELIKVREVHIPKKLRLVVREGGKSP